MYCSNSIFGRKMRFIADGCDQWRVSERQNEDLGEFGTGKILIYSRLL